MSKDTLEYVKACLTCQRSRMGRERRQGHLLTIPKATPFKQVHIDIWGPITTRDDKVWVLTMIDWSTRWVEAAVVRDLTARSIVKTFITSWITRFGVPTIVISDNAKYFKGELTTQALQMLGTRLNHNGLSSRRQQPYRVMSQTSEEDQELFRESKRKTYC